MLRDVCPGVTSILKHTVDIVIAVLLQGRGMSAALLPNKTLIALSALDDTGGIVRSPLQDTCAFHVAIERISTKTGAQEIGFLACARGKLNRDAAAGLRWYSDQALPKAESKKTEADELEPGFGHGSTLRPVG
ncbi:MAG: hypothetical protein ABS35_13735 [Kaistia sp. SCN 65-12]|nr:MAG: hypothetical protein ABS35_13735 [Kaistia sp. SCN 65-12]